MFNQKKRLIENTRSLDVQVISKLSNGKYEIRYENQTDVIEKYEEKIILNANNQFKLIKSKTGYGERYFFQCKCDQRIKFIYLVKDIWACRHCHNLTYKLRNLTKTQIEFYKVNTRIDILLAELGMTLDEASKAIVKPRNMQVKTFYNKLDELLIQTKRYSTILDGREQKLYERILRWWR